MSLFKSPVFLIFLIAVLLRGFMTYYNLTTPSVFIQQDRYADYAQALADGSVNTTLNRNDAQLFPGYPMLILLLLPITHSPIIAGITVSFLSSLGVIYVTMKLFKDLRLGAFLVFFPPWWVKQAGKVANEPVFVFSALLAIFAFVKKKYVITGLLVGFACIIRPIGISLLVSIIVVTFLQKRYKGLLPVLFGVAVSFAGLLLYNYTVFGQSDILKQLVNTTRYNGLRLGVIQLAQDFYRTIDWGQYKIFLSGLFYVSTNLLALSTMFFYRKHSLLTQLFFYWFLFSILFILLPSPFTLLDDFGRYALAVVPAYTVGIVYFIWFLYKKFILQKKYV